MPVDIDKLEDRRLTRRQAEFLSGESGISKKKLAKMKVSEVIDELRFVVDPQLLTHRRVCGTVVRVNPETGEKEPVPHATVHVEDTDCRLVGYFPRGNPLWWWAWILSCNRETLATVTTDDCGRFCVLIPRWDIDYVLRLRSRWVCPPVRPRLNDLLSRIPQVPRPIPEPPVFNRPLPIDQITQNRPGLPNRAVLSNPQMVADRDAFDKNMVLQSVLGPLAPTIEPQTEVMLGEAGIDQFERPVFEVPVAAPLSGPARKRASEQLGDDVAVALQNAPIGPFLRCYKAVSFEWSAFVDIPDISFRVTQDIDGDGDEETIYDEGLFDVRWDDDDNEPVELIASASAKSTPACGSLEEVVCQDTPGILAVGRMPLLEAGDSPAFHDHASGFAVRPNRPRLAGTPDMAFPAPGGPEARAPYARDLQLVGCVGVEDAAFYQVLYSHGEATDVPFMESWTAAADPTVTAAGHVDIAPDADGWYRVEDIREQLEDHWLLNWRTGRYANGRYDVKLLVADSSKDPIAESEIVPFVIDNARPALQFTSIVWTQQGEPDIELVGQECPIIERSSAAKAVTLTVKWSATAEHLRSAKLKASGCGGADPSKDGGAPELWWHSDVLDTGEIWETVYKIEGGAPIGAYSLSLSAVGRGFSPAGESGAGGEWFVDPDVNTAYSQFRFALIV